MPGSSLETGGQSPLEYRDRQGHVWLASEVAQLRVVSPSIDGPNLCLVIRFEREGEERFARWIGGEEWRLLQSLHWLFAEAEGGAGSATSTEKKTIETVTPAMVSDDELPHPVGPAPPETVKLWVDLVKSMGPDELDSFEQRTFAAWERASLGDLQAAIRRRRRDLAD